MSHCVARCHHHSPDVYARIADRGGDVRQLIIAGDTRVSIVRQAIRLGSAARTNHRGALRSTSKTNQPSHVRCRISRRSACGTTPRARSSHQPNQPSLLHPPAPIAIRAVGCWPTCIHSSLSALKGCGTTCIAPRRVTEFVSVVVGQSTGADISDVFDWPPRRGRARYIQRCTPQRCLSSRRAAFIALGHNHGILLCMSPLPVAIPSCVLKRLGPRQMGDDVIRGPSSPGSTRRAR